MTIFIDSSILVEYIKGNNTELFDYLLESDTKLVSNPIVFSEYIFYFLALAGNKSPLAIKEKSKIPGLLKDNNPQSIFSPVEILTVDENITVLSYELMQKHNLLPNNALILATLKLNEIKYLASFDKKDFDKACKKRIHTINYNSYRSEKHIMYNIGKNHNIEIGTFIISDIFSCTKQI